jgi:hypothetical protein
MGGGRRQIQDLINKVDELINELRRSDEFHPTRPLLHYAQDWLWLSARQRVNEGHR